eukprot:6456672-Amphidinium_carterae.1
MSCELLGAANADEALFFKAMPLVLAVTNPAAMFGVITNQKVRRHLQAAHRLGENIHSGIAELSYVQSESQRADSLTKAYSKPLLMRLRLVPVAKCGYDIRYILEVMLSSLYHWRSLVTEFMNQLDVGTQQLVQVLQA